MEDSKPTFGVTSQGSDMTCIPNEFSVLAEGLEGPGRGSL